MSLHEVDREPPTRSYFVIDSSVHIIVSVSRERGGLAIAAVVVVPGTSKYGFSSRNLRCWSHQFTTCVCCHPIYSGRQACGRTSPGHTGGRSHRISHPPSFCGACLHFSREKDSAIPFPRRP